MKSIKANFNMSKNFVAQTLIDFYNGDNSFSNPMKMFVEYGAFDAEVVEMVYAAKLGIKKDFFNIDLWLNGLSNMITMGDSISTKIEAVLADRYHGIDSRRYKTHFYEATLDSIQFEFLYPIFLMIKELKKPTPIIKEIEYIGKLLDHKDFPIDVRLKLYDETNNEYFLPVSVKDIFLF